MKCVFKIQQSLKNFWRSSEAKNAKRKLKFYNNYYNRLGISMLDFVIYSSFIKFKKLVIQSNQFYLTFLNYLYFLMGFHRRMRFFTVTSKKQNKQIQQNDIIIKESISSIMNCTEYNEPENSFEVLEKAFEQFSRSPTSKKLRSHFMILLSKTILDIQSHEKFINSLLQVPYQFRTSQLLDKFQELFSNLEYFQKLNEKYGEKYKNKIFTYMQSQSYVKGKRLTKVGEVSDKFFIILKGEVLVLYIRNSKDIEFQTSQLLKYGKLSNLSKREKILQRIQNHYYFKGVYVEQIQDYESYFNHYGIPTHYVEEVLVKGKCFGELGIIYNQKRMANIISKVDSLVGTISAEKYLSLIAQNEVQSINQTLRFLQRNFYSKLQTMDLERSQRYFYLFSNLQKKMNSEIFTLNSQVNGFYIILQGSVALKTQKVETVTSNRQNMSRKICNYMKQVAKKKLLDVKNLMAGQSFGLEQAVEYLKNQSATSSIKILYKYTAVTTSYSKLLFCPLHKLLKVIKNDKNLIPQLEQKIALKKKLQLNRKQNLIGKCKSSARLNISNSHQDYEIQQTALKQKKNSGNFPMRYVVNKKPFSVIKSQTYYYHPQKYEQSNNRKIAGNPRPNSAFLTSFFETPSKRLTLIQRNSIKADKQWKTESNDESEILINIINDKIKLSEKMKQPQTSQQYPPRKKFLNNICKFVKRKEKAI